MKDLEVQEKYGVDYKRYWVDEKEGKIFCLVEAPDAEAANRVHREGHGLVAHEIYEVTERTFARLHQFKRLLVRYDPRADIHEAFLAIACCLVCFRRLQTSVKARSTERACLLSPIDLHPGRA